MTKVKQVFDIAMSLIDERLETGLTDPNSTAIFKQNTPYILTSLQDELIEFSNKTKTYLITKPNKTENVDGYEPYEMPDDYFDVYQIVQIRDKKRYLSNNYEWEGKKTLLIPDDFVGSYKVIYYAVPETITDMEDELVLDDITCRTILANGLASRLLTNENQKLSNYFGQIYEELKNKPRQIKARNVTKIIDKIGINLNH